MNTSVEKRAQDLNRRQQAPLLTPTDLNAAATRDIAASMNGVLADVFALYLKTKNFHWHMSGPHFRDYHLMLDEQADQLFALTDPIAERIRKVGGSTLKSIGHIARTQRILDNDAEYVEPLDMARPIPHKIAYTQTSSVDAGPIRANARRASPPEMAVRFSNHFLL